MKTFIPLMAFALLLLFGCAKEESALTTENMDAQKVEESTSVWVLNFDSESPVWEMITIGQQQSNSGSSTTIRSYDDSAFNSNGAQTLGYFHGLGSSGLAFVSFSGTQNNGRAEGNAEYQKSGSSGNLHIFVYLAMKPAEWLFLLALYTSDRVPESRIGRQYIRKEGRKAIAEFKS